MVAHNWGMTELIESALRTGANRYCAGRPPSADQEGAGVPNGWALGIEARSRALLNEGEISEPRFREAVERLSRARVHAELARVPLLYGEWLRRANRQADARRELTRAHKTGCPTRRSAPGCSSVPARSSTTCARSSPSSASARAASFTRPCPATRPARACNRYIAVGERARPRSASLVAFRRTGSALQREPGARFTAAQPSPA